MFHQCCFKEIEQLISSGGRENIKTCFIFEICKVAAIMMSLETVKDVEMMEQAWSGLD